MDQICGYVESVVPTKKVIRRSNGKKETLLYQTPMKGIKVTLYKAENESTTCCSPTAKLGEAVTDQNGGFQFAGYTAGYYWLVLLLKGGEAKVPIKTEKYDKRACEATNMDRVIFADATPEPRVEVGIVKMLKRKGIANSFVIGPDLSSRGKRGICFQGSSVEKLYYVYILASRSRNLYTGVTNNLVRRTFEHRQGLVPGFTSRYRIHRLVYLESFRDVRAAISREKRIKSWGRAKRVALIEARNPTWEDLAADLFSPFPRKADPSLRSG